MGVNQPTAETLAHIRDLVAEEKALRAQLQHGDITESEEHDRLRRVEIELDQCWDLLRQRRALRETGGDPREAAVRPRRPGRGIPRLGTGSNDDRRDRDAVDFDVIVVGGGHNGLVAAGYLARAGLRVRLLERLGQIGGAAVSAQAFDGVEVRVSRYSYLVSLLPPRIVEDLGAAVRLARRQFSSYTPRAG